MRKRFGSSGWAATRTGSQRPAEFAAISTPSAGAAPHAPVPATVVILPSADHRSTRLKPSSAMRTPSVPAGFPIIEASAGADRPVGYPSVQDVANASLALPGSDPQLLPAIVLIGPMSVSLYALEETRRTRHRSASAKKYCV